jgi:hypothetical protein
VSRETRFCYDPSKTPDRLRAALKLVAEDFPLVAARNAAGVKVVFRFPADGPKFEYRAGVAEVSGKTVPQVLRALAALRGFARAGKIPPRHEETPRFDTLGFSLDVSRGAVWTVPAIRMLLRRMALMGMNTFLLYTEDVYEVPGQPYFGYLRGRYTASELRGLDDCAFALGIEMFPCIQTLSHLFLPLRWPAFRDVRDTYYILLAGEKKTYALIEQLLRAASAPYRSKRIHLGMDEAGEAGLHRYREIHGLRPRISVCLEHLRDVTRIAKRLGLAPMIWSDMFVRGHGSANPKDVYLRRPRDLAPLVPRDVQFVYWDYYNNVKRHYVEWIDRHRAIGKEPIFAPGLWTWHRFWSNFRKVRTSTDAGMSACKEKGVREAIITAWGDDGTEADMLSVLPGLQYFAGHGYADAVSDEVLALHFAGSCGSDVNAWTLGDAIDWTPGAFERDGLHPANPSKYLLWQDPLMGLFDPHVEGIPLATHYRKVSRRLRRAARWRRHSCLRSGQAGGGSPERQFANVMPAPPCTEAGDHLALPLALSEVLEDKAELGVRLRRAYLSRNRKALKEFRDVVLPRLARRVKRLHEIHRAIWFSLYKPNGWEIIDGRYSTLEARLASARMRLDDYLRGRVEALPELGEPRLPVQPWPKGTLTDGGMSWRYIVTPSVTP